MTSNELRECLGEDHPGHEHCLAELLMREIQSDDAEALADKLIASQPTQGPLGVAWAVKGKLAEESGDDEEAMRAFAQAKRLTEESGIRRYHAFVLFEDASFNWLETTVKPGGRLREFLRVNDYCANDPTCVEVRVRALNGIGAVALNRGAVVSARDYFQQALAVDSDLDLTESKMLPKINLGILEWMQGEHELSMTLLEKAWESAEQAENEKWSHSVAWALASCAIHTDQPTKAIEYVDRAKKNQDGINTSAEQTLVVLRCLAQALVGDGDDPDELRNLLDSSLKEMEQDERFYPMSVILKARTELALGSPKSALTILDEVAPHLTQPVNQIDALELKTRLLATLGRDKEALQAHTELNGILRDRYVTNSKAERELANEISTVQAQEFERRESELTGTQSRLTSTIASLVALGLVISAFGVLAIRRKERARRTLQAEQEQGLAQNKVLVGELREKEDALQRKHRLEALGELTSGVAHDFNNLLTVILTSNELLLMDTGEDRSQLSATNKELIDQSTHAVTVAAELTAQLLAYGRKQRLKPEVIDLRSFLTRIEPLLRQTISPHSQLSIELSGSDAIYIRIDETHLTTALINLCSNSRDALANVTDGQIQIEVARKTVAGECDLADGDYVEIRTTDNGIGMSEADLVRACEPFFTTKPPAAGTGLGLSSVQGFVDQSGGTLRISSSKANFTSVTMLLPESQAVPATASAETSSPARKGATCLVVDDDNGVRAMVSRMLETAGVEVSTATGIRDAKTHFRDIIPPPDTLLTDVRMSRPKDGIELAQWVQERYPEVRVVLMSGYYDPHAFNDFTVLTKPFSFSELMQTLEVSSGA